MAIQLNPYLNFRGQAREAMTFYQSVLGGDLDVTAFADLGDSAALAAMGVSESEADLVMHSSLSVSDAVQLMGADVPSRMEGEFPNGRISLSGDDHATLQKWFDGLSEGGSVNMPLDKAPWGDWFGDLTDRFGVSWMVDITGSPED